MSLDYFESVRNAGPGAKVLQCPYDGMSTLNAFIIAWFVRTRYGAGGDVACPAPKNASKI